jgi:hypothetical protein
MKTPKTNSGRRIVVIALLAATTIVTIGMTAVVVPASSIVKPAYAQLDDISDQIIGEEIEIPQLDDISEKVEELTSQWLPTLPEQATLTPLLRSPPAFAD